jgi:hypothetical protein
MTVRGTLFYRIPDHTLYSVACLVLTLVTKFIAKWELEGFGPDKPQIEMVARSGLVPATGFNDDIIVPSGAYWSGWNYRSPHAAVSRRSACGDQQMVGLP